MKEQNTREIDALRNRIVELEAKVEELTAECGYDQRNAAASQEEAYGAYERVKKLEAALAEERAKVERLRDILRSSFRNRSSEEDAE